MKNRISKVLGAIGLLSLAACSQNNNVALTGGIEEPIQNNQTVENKPHNYGGWYCPDNLRGFPAVDIADWKNVPVVNGRMPTQEEARNGSSLIFVDPAEHPNAKPLTITMPKLASFYNKNVQREDLVIVIQAFTVNEDSIVGFRYLNGGNGSARLNEVKFLSDAEIKEITPSKFVSLGLEVNTTKDVIWEILTKSENVKNLQKIFDKDNQLNHDWRTLTNVNFSYKNAGAVTAIYGDELFGNFYIQNDFTNLNYTEKFMLSENEETRRTEFTIVCGPYANDFEEQKKVLTTWANKVKELSEKE